MTCMATSREILLLLGKDSNLLSSRFFSMSIWFRIIKRSAGRKKLWIELYNWDTAIVSPGRALYTGKNIQFWLVVECTQPRFDDEEEGAQKEYKENERKVGWWNARENRVKKREERARADRRVARSTHFLRHSVGEFQSSRSLGLGGV